MLGHLSLSICLMSVSAQPPAAGADVVPVAPAGMSGQAAYGAPQGGAYGGTYVGGTGSFAPAAGHESMAAECCPHCGQRHHHKGTPLHDWLCPPCNLTQRYPYYPKDHGHYYFRPYHMQRVQEQQAIAVTWGEDPRNPYGQLVFERVYDQIRAEQAAKAEQVAPPLPAPPAVDKSPLPAPPVPENEGGANGENPLPPKNEQSSWRPIKVRRQ
jgi:ribosomal protein L37AE/L43A